VFYLNQKKLETASLMLNIGAVKVTSLLMIAPRRAKFLKTGMEN